MAGRAVSITCVARTLGKIVTKSTHSNAARTSARSASELSGRPRALQRSHRLITIDRHGQEIAELTRLCQITHVPDMKQVKTTVGENKSFPGPTNFSGAPGKFRESYYLGIHAHEGFAHILAKSAARSIWVIR